MDDNSTISFSVVVKVTAYHPSDPGSIPASVIFYNLFFFLSFFWGGGGFTARQYYFTHFEPNRKVGRRIREKTPDHPRVERLVSHVTRDRLESSVVRCF